ncbi:MAG: M28 family peptidase [Phycisphaerales bacterium]|nr:M28 family peptidase [Phycisphaerales bacterium]
MSAARAEGPTSGGAAAIDFSAERYHAHINLLASDLLKGRDTGSDGIDIAAGYIAGQFAAIGLQPGGTDGTYFQEFTLNLGGKMKDTTTLTFSGAELPALSRGTNWTAYGWSSQGAFEGDVVFVGYGIVNPEKNYDDYAGVDVKGKIAFMLRREPAGWRAEGGPGFSRHSWFGSKANLAKEKGAVGMIVVNQATEDQDTLGGSARSGENYEISAVQVKREVADALLKAAGMEPLADVQKKLDAGTNGSKPLGAIHAAGAVEFEGLPARNVIGVLPGTGPNADEYVVIGAHYDHVGEQGGQIHNGADDNASGTSGVIEVARAMALTPGRNRSLLFMTFTGEEKGLLGSAQYCRTPTVPIEKIACMMNMDMIGRFSSEETQADNHLWVEGLGTGDSFKAIVDRQTKACGFEAYNPDESARGPSDHASFYEAGVPSLFFFTGLHPDYHQPGDDAPKINAVGGANIARLVYNIALELANPPARPVFARVDTPARISLGQGQGGGRPRVFLGIVPGEDDGKKGWLISGVSAGGPAEKGGMKAGDRIVAVNGQDVNNLGEYRKSVEGKKGGDEVEVKVLRGTEALTLKLTLSGG